MTTNDNQRKSKYSPERYAGEKPYNDVPCEPNQVLAPFVFRDETMLKSEDINRDNLKIFKFGGKRVLVGFVPVEVANFYSALRVFNMHVNEYLNRYSNKNTDDLSLDDMLDKMHSSDDGCGYDPTGVPSHEEKLMLLETLNELIDEVYRRNPKYGRVLKLIYGNVDITKSEIIATLGLKKSQGYKVIQDAQQMAKEVYKELNT